VSSLLAIGGSYVAFVLRNQMVERTTLALDTELGAAASSIVGIEHFERHDYLDKVEILRQNHQTLARLPDWAAVLLGTAARVAVTLAVLATIDWRLLLLPVFSSPAVFGTFRMQRILYGSWDKVAPHWRLQFALFRVGADEPGGRELRVLDRRGHLAARFSHEVDAANGPQTGRIHVRDGVKSREPLSFTGIEDGRTYVAPHLIALRVQRCWIMDLEEELKQIPVRNGVGVIDDLHRLAVIAAVVAGRVRGVPARISDSR
jgi:hypothetical protein